MPTIAVLMPVYHAERYVAEAVESILAQTYRDLGFLIVDDGSTEGSLAIATRFARRDDRIRSIGRPNTGYTRALNETLGLARGDVIARLDADGGALPGRFLLQVKMASDQACDRRGLPRCYRPHASHRPAGGRASRRQVAPKAEGWLVGVPSRRSFHGGEVRRAIRRVVTLAHGRLVSAGVCPGQAAGGGT